MLVVNLFIGEQPDIVEDMSALIDSPLIWTGTKDEMRQIGNRKL
jgi:hypothetical protein